ncbi:MAG: radical SAM protein [Nostocales cyanobacterium W4_Combined_metabat2_030]|nr:radical SAM protein [Nostocales cyanobacterium W4_Combined_metabat2_030]
MQGTLFTSEIVRKLKQAGLVGVVVSLDHYEPEKHNQFRGNKHAYEWAENAAKASVKANLVTALSLCATNGFVNEANLMGYMNLSRKFGVAFVQILEPQAVGHYKGKDVELDKDKIKMLEDFYFRMNHDKNYRDFPIVCYHGYFNHHTGCMGAGNRHLYVDTDGDINPCPFCRHKTGNALTADIVDSARQMQVNGCFIFKNNT